MGYFDDLPWFIKRGPLILSSLGFLLDGYDLSSISFTGIFIKQEFGLTTQEYGLLNASSLIGMAIGAILLGRLSDRLGRKTLLGIDLFFFAVFGIGSALSRDFTELFINRLLLGVGIGGDYPISSSFISELAPSQKRGRYLVASVSMYWVGTALSSISSLLFLPAGGFFWRYVFLAGGVSSIPIALFRLRISESPRWKILRGEVSGENMPTPEMERGGIDGLRGLMKGNVAPFVFSVSLIWFLFDVASYGIGIYYSPLLKEFSFRSNGQVLLANLLIAGGALLGYLVAYWLVDRLGRRILLLVGFGSMASLLILGGTFSITGPALLPFFMTFVAFEQWAGAVTLFYPTEMFPTSVRSTVQGIATAASRVGAILGVYYFPQMIASMGLSSSLTLFGLSSLIAFIASWIVVRETSRVQLEDIRLVKGGPEVHNRGGK